MQDFQKKSLMKASLPDGKAPGVSRNLMIPMETWGCNYTTQSSIGTRVAQSR